MSIEHNTYLLELELPVFVEFLVGNLVDLHGPGVCCFVAGCPAAKVEQ